MSKNINVAINGFGRIGRVTLRALLTKKNITVVALNDLTDSKTLAHLFKYDSVHGKFAGDVSVDGNDIIINGNRIVVLSEKNPAALPWKDLNVDVVIESTGFFTKSKDLEMHLQAGAKKAILSAPASDDMKSVVLGVNDSILTGDEKIVSNASCTTNCAAPMVKVLEEAFGIDSGFISTIHAFTGDQKLHDAPHKDLRRARAAGYSIIPTSTGAAKAITLIFPNLKGKLGGSSLRVPVIDGSITEFTLTLKKEDVTVEEINAAFKKAADGDLKGILEYTTDPIVSCDIIGNPHSCIFDSKLTDKIGKMVKVVGWYDNEYGYSNRLADLIVKMG